MTLRLRLVLALVALVAVGLALFGVATYTLYARSLYKRLDDQIRASVPSVTRDLGQAAGLGGEGSGPAHQGSPEPHEPGPGDGDGRDGGGGPAVLVPPGTYAELRDRTGKTASYVELSESSARPQLPESIAPAGGQGRFFTTGSSTGSGNWRVYVVPANLPNAYTAVIAVPMAETVRSLNRLTLIEALGAAALLAALSIGAWVILRRGLRPLETMATTAGTIVAGDPSTLSKRVEPSGGPTEVGQLGLALNTMLAGLEQSFAEREATEQRLRQFLSDASHELRTPLTSIQGFAELFRLGDDAAGREHVDLPTIMRRIEQESDRMRVLVEDLLLLARLDETRPAERAPVDLAVLAADACSDAVAVAPERPITLDAPDPVVVPGDQVHLRQAIANLVSNAVRHTPDGVPIEVSARVDGSGCAVVAVRDHGPGLDEEALTHVFDRFWQADKARVGTGAGLGLAIVAGIASEHGGSVAAANADGGGAVFTVRLPRSAEVGAKSQEGPRPD